MNVGANVLAYDIRNAINTALLLFALVVEAVAFVHCLTQRPTAFGAIGTMSKGGWLGLIIASVAITVFGQYLLGPFAFIAVAIPAIYMLDVRPALKDATDGPNSW